MDDNKLYKVVQKEYMYNNNGDIIGSVDVHFKVRNGKLITMKDNSDEDEGELLELDFRKEYNK